MSIAKAAKFRVLLVDDHPLVRRGLASLVNEEPDLMVCGEAADARQGLSLMGSARPDLAIVDISLRDCDGIEFIRSIQTTHPDVPILVMSIHKEAVYAERALRAGASGYVMKAELPTIVMTAIRRVLAGKIFVSDMMADRVLRHVAGHGRGGQASAVERLSNRELQIFSLLGNGFGIREIAARLSLSVKTVESHRVNIKGKLNLKTSAQLLRYAIQFFRAEQQE